MFSLKVNVWNYSNEMINECLVCNCLMCTLGEILISCCQATSHYLSEFLKIYDATWRDQTVHSDLKEVQHCVMYP